MKGNVHISSDHRTEIIARKVKGSIFDTIHNLHLGLLLRQGKRGIRIEMETRHAEPTWPKKSAKIELSIKRPINKLQKLEDAPVEEMLTSAKYAKL